MIDFYHPNLICGDCVVMQSSYFTELVELALAASTEFEDGASIPVIVCSSKNLVGCLLTSPEISPLFLIAPTDQEPNQEQSFKIYRHFTKKIVLKIKKMKSGEYSIPQLELLLYLVVSLKNASMLRFAFGLVREPLPRCLLAATLQRAIQCSFVEGVEILIEKGASPNWLTADSPFLNFCLANVRLSTRYLPLSEEKINISTFEIVKLVVHNGIKWYPGKYGRPVTLLHYVGNLALKSAKAVETIIEASPAELFSSKMSILDDLTLLRNSTTPLENALIGAAEAALSEQDRKAKISRILSSAVLPLLRSGSKVKCDFFNDSSTFNAFKLLANFCFLEFQSSMNGRHWPDLMVNLLVDIRETAEEMTSFNVSQFIFFIELLLVNHHQSESNCVRFKTLVLARYPRPLGALCRSTILRRLPVGYRSRQNAIDTLDLPKRVAGFLKFKEHDLLIKIVS